MIKAASLRLPERCPTKLRICSDADIEAGSIRTPGTDRGHSIDPRNRRHPAWFENTRITPGSMSTSRQRERRDRTRFRRRGTSPASSPPHQRRKIRIPDPIRPFQDVIPVPMPFTASRHRILISKAGPHNVPDPRSPGPLGQGRMGKASLGATESAGHIRRSLPAKASSSVIRLGSRSGDGHASRHDGSSPSRTAP
jgi:hypothetical protein